MGFERAARRDHRLREPDLGRNDRVDSRILVADDQLPPGAQFLEPVELALDQQAIPGPQDELRPGCRRQRLATLDRDDDEVVVTAEQEREYLDF